MRKLIELVATLGLASILSSCASADGAGDVNAPTLLALSTSSISIGQPIDFFGANFVNHGKTTHPEIHFKGSFKAESGQTYAVDYRMSPVWEDGNRVVWPFVGPYKNPFTSAAGDQMGVFTGEVSALNIDGEVEAESDSIEATLTVGPSIVVRDLQPLGATCGEPAKRVLGGYPYKISVEAIGFKPVNFSYVVVGEQNQNEPRVFLDIAKNNATTDTFGTKGELVFADVPNGQNFYYADFAVKSLGTDGVVHSMLLTIGVHRPIEYIDSGETKIAQIEQAQPDSGCLSGGVTNGSTVTYTQTHTDTRTRTVGVTWDQSWLNSVTQGQSSTNTNSVNWSATHTDMQGWEFGWEAGTSVEAKGGVSIPVLAEASVSATVSGGIHGNHTWGYTDSRSVGGDYSQSDTESLATTTSHNVSSGGSNFFEVSSADSTSLAVTGLILPGRFGVFYRQTTRIAIPSTVIAYDLCGESQVVAQSNFYDYIWSVDLAQGDSCSPLPVSKLPEAQCLMDPC